MPIDWNAIARARGLDLSEAELKKVAVAMDALEPAYKTLTANLTPDMEPFTTIGEEAVEAR